MQECKRDNLGRGKWFYIHPTEQGGGEEVKQGEMEVVCLSQTYQVALCCLLHHDLRQYCAPYNGLSHTCMGQGIGHFHTRNGLSLHRREPGALMYSLLVDVQ